MTKPSLPDKRDIRASLWGVSFLGGALGSIDDDHLDDADLALDSLSLIWFALRLEQVTGQPVLRQPGLATSLRTVNEIHRFVLELARGHLDRPVGPPP